MNHVQTISNKQTGFQVHTPAGSGGGGTTKPFISFSKNGYIGFNKAFVDKSGVYNGSQATLWFNQETNEVAIVFQSNKTPQSLKFNINKRRRDGSTNLGGYITSHSFFKTNNINVALHGGRYYNYKVVRNQELGLDTEGYAYLVKLGERYV